MTALPDGFRMLEGDERLAAKELWESYSRGLEPEAKRGNLPGRNEFSRLLCADGAPASDADHMAAVRDAAAAVGERVAWIANDTGVSDESLGFVAIEVDLAAAAQIGDGALGIPEISPSTTGTWALLSTTASWGYVNTDFGDFGAMSGDRAFMQKYRQSRPSCVLDPMLWLFGDGHYMTYEIEHDPQVGLLRRLFSDSRIAVTRRDAFLRRYFEGFYSRADADWIWETFVGLEDDEPPMTVVVERASLISRLGPAAQELEARLTAIWDESVPD